MRTENEKKREIEHQIKLIKLRTKLKQLQEIHELQTEIQNLKKKDQIDIDDYLNKGEEKNET